MLMEVERRKSSAISKEEVADWTLGIHLRAVLETLAFVKTMTTLTAQGFSTIHKLL